MRVEERVRERVKVLVMVRVEERVRVRESVMVMIEYMHNQLIIYNYVYT